jgi:hypothetical protein
MTRGDTDGGKALEQDPLPVVLDEEDLIEISRIFVEPALEALPLAGVLVVLATALLQRAPGDLDAWMARCDEVEPVFHALSRQWEEEERSVAAMLALICRLLHAAASRVEEKSRLIVTLPV